MNFCSDCLLVITSKKCWVLFSVSLFQSFEKLDSYLPAIFAHMPPSLLQASAAAPSGVASLFGRRLENCWRIFDKEPDERALQAGQWS